MEKNQTRISVYDSVTNNIIAKLEQGLTPLSYYAWQSTAKPGRLF